MAHGTIDRFFRDIFRIESDALGYFVGLGIESVEFAETIIMHVLLLARAALLVSPEAPSIQTLLSVLGRLVIPTLVRWGVSSNDDGGRSVEDLAVSLDRLGGDRRGRSAQLFQYRWTVCV